MANSTINKLVEISSNIATTFFFKLLVALFIILLGFVIGRIAGKIVKRVLSELELNSLVKKASGKRISVESFFEHAVSWIIYFFVIVMALNQLGLTTILLYILSGALVVLIVVFIILGLRDVIPNIIAGLTMQKKGFLLKGDKIEFKGIVGKIEYINLIETRIITKKKDIISIPNSLLIKHEIIKKH